VTAVDEYERTHASWVHFETERVGQPGQIYLVGYNRAGEPVWTLKYWGSELFPFAIELVRAAAEAWAFEREVHATITAMEEFAPKQ
jgi:hypothetical protein